MSHPKDTISQTTSTVENFSKFFVELGGTGQWFYFTITLILFYLLIFLILYLAKYGEPQTRTTTSIKVRVLKSDFFFVLLIALIITFLRLPHLMRGVLNPDESFWIAIAKTLYHDPRFWVSVDGGTGGPIVPFSLIILKLFGLPIDSGSSKLIANIFIIGSVSSVFIFFRQVTSPLIARLSILPFVVLASITSFYDLVAYNSEHVAVFILGLALIFLPKLSSQKATPSYSSISFVGIFLGLIPFVKLQAVPLGLLMGLFACYLLLRKKHYSKALVLVIISIVPTALILLTVFLYGGIENFWVSYVSGNFQYTSRYAIPDDAFSYFMSLFFELIEKPPELKYFVYFGFCINLIAILWLLLLPKKFPKTDKEYVLFSLLLIITSIYCVVAPNNSRFYHYIILFIFPVAISIGISLYVICSVISKAVNESNRTFFSDPTLQLIASTGFIFISSFFYFHQFFTYNISYYQQGVEHSKGYVRHGNLVSYLKNYYSSNERMAVWGWANDLYEHTDFLMGTRHATASVILDHPPLENYYTSNYLSDLVKNKPLVFVQAVGPSYFAYKDSTEYGYQNFPVIKDYINSNYQYMNEIDEAKVFIRKQDPIDPWISKGISDQPNSNVEFIGYLDSIEKVGSLIYFKGWGVLGSSPSGQTIQLSLISKGDTLLAKSYQTPRSDVVLAYNNLDLLNSGYYGYIQLEQLTAEEYQLGFYIKKGTQVYFKNLNKLLIIDEL